jgi:hypothetical protein
VGTFVFSANVASSSCFTCTRRLVTIPPRQTQAERCEHASFTAGSKSLTSSPIFLAMSGGISPFTTRFGFGGIVFIFCGFNMKSSLHSAFTQCLSIVEPLCF